MDLVYYRPDNTWIAVEMVNKASFTCCCLLCLSCQPELSAYSFTNNFYIVSCGHKQNKRGGRVKLQSIVMPVMEFDHPEKGDALYSMELALALEKLTNEKLLSLHQIAVDNNDAQMCDFIESEFLNEQVEAIKKISVYISQLRRVGKGHGTVFLTL
jgi:hypothetical protein